MSSTRVSISSSTPVRRSMRRSRIFSQRARFHRRRLVGEHRDADAVGVAQELELGDERQRVAAAPGALPELLLGAERAALAAAARRADDGEAALGTRAVEVAAASRGGSRPGRGRRGRARTRAGRSRGAGRPRARRGPRSAPRPDRLPPPPGPRRRSSPRPRRAPRDRPRARRGGAPPSRRSGGRCPITVNVWGSSRLAVRHTSRASGSVAVIAVTPTTSGRNSASSRAMSSWEVNSDIAS